VVFALEVVVDRRDLVAAQLAVVHEFLGPAGQGRHVAGAPREVVRPAERGNPEPVVVGPGLSRQDVRVRTEVAGVLPDDEHRAVVDGDCSRLASSGLGGARKPSRPVVRRDPTLFARLDAPFER
jgi:hypothetical protein